MAISLFLGFVCWWGWIALAFFTPYLPDEWNKWYIVIPLFILATAWAFWFAQVAERIRKKLFSN